MIKEKLIEIKEAKLSKVQMRAIKTGLFKGQLDLDRWSANQAKLDDFSGEDDEK